MDTGVPLPGVRPVPPGPAGPSFRPLLLTRPAEAGREPLEAYRAHGGYVGLGRALRDLSPAEVCAEVERAELRGRGGAAFPTGRKWELARRAPGDGKYVVANGGEHEPGSRKDRHLITRFPHKVLEGMAICGWATGARVGYLYLIEDMEEGVEAAEIAIAEGLAAGCLGDAILGSSFDFEVRLQLAPTTYVAGEETAVLEVIEGKPPVPRKKPPYPGEAGLHGLPTTVNNLETLAHVPAILRHGAGWFRAHGVPGSGGSMLFTLDERVNRPGVHELPFGATFRDLVEGSGGGLRSGRALRAILPALSSRFLPASSLDLPLSHDAVRAAGSGLGCGGVTLIEQGECVVERVRDIARFFQEAQCGTCPPCRMETSTLAAILDKVVRGEGGDYRGQVERIAAFTARKGNCSLIEMAAAPVLSALELFPEDFARHVAEGRCPGAAG